MVLVEAPILGSRVAWASSDLVQVAGVSPRVLEGRRASARLVLILSSCSTNASSD
jgi:hypothetical protein